VVQEACAVSEPGELAEAVLGVLREQEREQTAGAAPTEA
jgi:hypothetical protein